MAACRRRRALRRPRSRRPFSAWPAVRDFPVRTRPPRRLLASRCSPAPRRLCGGAPALFSPRAAPLRRRPGLSYEATGRTCVAPPRQASARQRASAPTSGSCPTAARGTSLGPTPAAPPRGHAAAQWRGHRRRPERRRFAYPGPAALQPVLRGHGHWRGRWRRRGQQRRYQRRRKWSARSPTPTRQRRQPRRRQCRSTRAKSWRLEVRLLRLHAKFCVTHSVLPMRYARHPSCGWRHRGPARSSRARPPGGGGQPPAAIRLCIQSGPRRGHGAHSSCAWRQRRGQGRGRACSRAAPMGATGRALYSPHPRLDHARRPQQHRPTHWRRSLAARRAGQMGRRRRALRPSA